MNAITKLEQFDQFEKFLTDNKNFLVVLFFGADWSDESKLMQGVVEEILKNEKLSRTVRFIQVDAEEYEDISIGFDVEAVPTFVFLKNREVLQRVVGANAPELRKQVEQAAQVGQTFTNEKHTVDINVRLSTLINKAPVMLFMKGSPQEPRCGFSRTTIGILKEQNCNFSYFDILSDDEVREGLKKYSDWPTFPQLYINGELIGGLDILKEMIENGEFKAMIPEPKKEETLNDRLKKLLNRSKIMLFMKGHPGQPQCGFSRTTIGLLNETGQKYDTFDILADEEVRQGLKEYSEWPTYPQLYVDGELVGGLDIIKELIEGGEFEKTLKGSA